MTGIDRFAEYKKRGGDVKKRFLLDSKKVFVGQLTKGKKGV